MSTGDFVLGKNLALLGSLLDQGIKVALVYGDRDYQCNCESHTSQFSDILLPNNNCAKGYGGEQISLAIPSKVTNNFRQAGYAMIQTNKTYVGGFVRQYGNLSFSRILQAGHEGELRIE